ncbi:hypothetical protein ACFL2C_04090 [Patescibacteria group bacterium]
MSKYFFNSSLFVILLSGSLVILLVTTILSFTQTKNIRSTNAQQSDLTDDFSVYEKGNENEFVYENEVNDFVEDEVGEEFENDPYVPEPSL